MATIDFLMKQKKEDGTYDILHPYTKWTNVADGPESSVESIDTAVTNTHTHDNKDIIDKFSEENNTPKYGENELAFKSDIKWGNLADKPTTISGYGITDAVNTSEVVETATANKLLKLDSNAKLPANILNGVIPIENLPHGALERCIVVADDTARFALTTDNVQIGDTVKVTSSGMMYFVTDDSKLDSEDGYEIYTAGSASSVSWSGIIDKPTTLSGYGISDAVNTSEVVATAAPGKLLKLNADSKLPASITGDADTVDGKHADDFVDASEVVETATANKLLKLNAEGKLPADITGNASTASSVEWLNVENLPTTLSGYGITNAVNTSDVVTTATPNKILKLNSNSKLPASITGDADTVDGKHATDFVSVTEVVETATANKLLKLNADAKLPATILSGVIPIENLPHGALERCIVVENDTARFALTTETIQTGDTVKVVSSGKMYFVIDDSKLNSESGYEIYTAGSASSVSWSGITDKPTTLSGYGISDAVNTSEVSTTAVANKLLKLNAEGKLPADITGEAGSVKWANITNKPESSVESIDAAVTNSHTHTNKVALDKISETDGVFAYNGKSVAYLSDVKNMIVVSDTEPADLLIGGLWLQTSVTN